MNECYSKVRKYSKDERIQQPTGRVPTAQLDILQKTENHTETQRGNRKSMITQGVHNKEEKKVPAFKELTFQHVDKY